MSMCHSSHVGNYLPKKNFKMEELYDTEILDLAMENTYNFIIGDTTLEKLLDERKDFMPHLCDPQNTTPQDIENLLQYYEGEEEYEKCALIKMCLSIQASKLITYICQKLLRSINIMLFILLILLYNIRSSVLK